MRFDPTRNPTGVRCTYQDSLVNVFGRDPKTGFARRPFDNMGVQYGLAAFNAGKINVAQFLEINRLVGGHDVNGVIVADRTVADPDALRLAYETGRVNDGAHGLREILVIEEKGPVVETQLRTLFYNAPNVQFPQRPTILGKADAQGRPLVSATGELRPSRLIEIVAAWLARHDPALDRHEHVRDFTAPELLSNSGDSVKRLPYFCAGCPHNTSTKVPEGSSARAGIGCHFMANWMDRSTAGLIQMGGEGVDWVSHSMFTKTPHVFQNLGDGTYYHSGYLAIRQAVAAKATLTCIEPAVCTGLKPARNFVPSGTRPTISSKSSLSSFSVRSASMRSP
jgi:hypothetical protein